MTVERGVPRMPVRLEVLLPDGWKGEVLDASVTGMRVRSLLVVKVGETLDVTLQLEDGATLPMKGDVAWADVPDFAVNGSAEFGLAFSEVPQHYLTLLSTLFARS
jgi:hypothetical protein